MGSYLNPGNEKFKRAVRSEIYVDKTNLISKLETAEDCVVSCEARNDNTHESFSDLANFAQGSSPLGRVREGANPVGVNLNSTPMTFQETMSKLPKPSFMDKSDIGIKSSMLNSKNTGGKSVLRNLAERIK